MNDNQLKTIFEKLKSNSFKIACCSNSVKNTVETSLEKLGIHSFFDLILSNEDVKNAKPHPEIYWNAMSHFECYPEETLIVEDSPTGLKAAYKSGAKVLSQEFNGNSINVSNLNAGLYFLEIPGYSVKKFLKK